MTARPTRRILVHAMIHRMFVSFAIMLALLPASARAQATGTRAYAGEEIALPSPARFEALADPTPIPRSRWARYFTRDVLDRVIVFYVCAPRGDAAQESTPLPVIVFVQGSGSQSVFTRVETPDGVRYSPSGGQGSVAQAARERALAIVVEKPAVRFAESPARPGSGEQGSDEFRREHTLERWCAAVSAALKAALTLPRADRTRVLVEGHSEGGLVACKVAADNPEVTHIATLAGGGPTQLYDLIELARRGDFCGNSTQGGDECVRRMLTMWERVLANPDASDEFFLGHPHRRWSTFLATSPMEQLAKTRARVFIGQGQDDRAVLPASADILYASLRASGREATLARVPGDHAFMLASKDGGPDPAGWQAMHDRVVEWFLAP